MFCGCRFPVTCESSIPTINIANFLSEYICVTGSVAPVVTTNKTYWLLTVIYQIHLWTQAHGTVSISTGYDALSILTIRSKWNYNIHQFHIIHSYRNRLLLHIMKGKGSTQFLKKNLTDIKHTCILFRQDINRNITIVYKSEKVQSVSMKYGGANCNNKEYLRRKSPIPCSKRYSEDRNCLMNKCKKYIQKRSSAEYFGIFKIRNRLQLINDDCP